MNCIGIFGFIFGHKFKAIFNQEKGEPTFDASHKVILMQEDIDAIKLSCKMKETYVHSYCSRCGQIVKE